MSNLLQEYGIGITKDGKLNKGGELILECITNAQSSSNGIRYDFSDRDRASKFIAEVWKSVESKKAKDGVGNTVLGSAFECLLALVFCLEKISPFFMQAELSFVPNAKFDILMYDSSGWPISISIKTSLRERYKQADLEAMALKQVHRKSESYLITLNETEAAAQAKKIEKRDLVALDRIILATSSDFDQLLVELKSRKLIDPDLVPVIRYSEHQVNVKSVLEQAFLRNQDSHQ
jgi:hypothetical protein